MRVVFGFFIWNWPFGKIFMGDCGAYLIGFLISLNLICLVQRNPEVSPWFPIALLNYPIIEVLFSIYRKTIIRKGSSYKPDGIHFHMLIYKRVSRKIIKNQIKIANSLTSLIILIYFIITISKSFLGKIQNSTVKIKVGLFDNINNLSGLKHINQ